jgi:phage tail-like protein
MSDYPLPKYHFMVEAGMDRIGFTEASGLDIETEIIEYRDGADRNYVKQKIPGLKKTANVVLKRGMMKADNAFFEWASEVYYNKAERRDVTVSLLDETHQPVIVWKLRDAWPAKIASTDLKADGNEIAVETLELAHEGITIEAT